jgi:hypothetical protein
MATDTLEFKLVMRPAKMNFAVADAHRDNRKRFVVRADEKLTAFVELERAIYEFAVDAISENVTTP